MKTNNEIAQEIGIEYGELECSYDNYTYERDSEVLISRQNGIRTFEFLGGTVVAAAGFRPKTIVLVVDNTIEYNKLKATVDRLNETMDVTFYILKEEK